MEKSITLKKVKRQRKHGFLSKMASHNGKKVIQNRRRKGRSKVSL